MPALLDIGAMPEVLKGVGAFLATVTGTIIVPVAWAAWSAWKKRAKDTAAADHPTAPPANPFGNAPSSTTIEARELQAHVAAAIREMQLSDLREEMAAVRRDMNAVSDDYRAAAANLVKAQVQLDAANAKIATLEEALTKCQALLLMRQRELAAAETRAQHAARELAKHKVDSQAGLSTQPAGNITPLRPGPRPKGKP